MLQSRDDIRKDHAVDAFTDAILQRDQPRTAELFFNLVRRTAARWATRSAW